METQHCSEKDEWGYLAASSVVVYLTRCSSSCMDSFSCLRRVTSSRVTERSWRRCSLVLPCVVSRSTTSSTLVTPSTSCSEEKKCVAHFESPAKNAFQVNIQKKQQQLPLFIQVLSLKIYKYFQGRVLL